MVQTCPHCAQQSPENRTHCLFCGSPLPSVQTDPPSRRSREEPARFFQRIPSWGWLLLGFGGIALFILVSIAFISAVAFLEGFASLLLLAAGIFASGIFSRSAPSSLSPFRLAMIIGFFALMGMAIDQTGNRLYNRPLSLFCPAGSSLRHAVSVSHPLPGRTDMSQRFECLESDGTLVLQLSPFHMLGVRLAEYVLIGYLLAGLRSLVWRLRTQRQVTATS